MKTLNDERIKYGRVLAALLLAVGLAVRVVGIGSLPYGLNQDEASAGYDAWALLCYGTDRCGNSLPVLLESWGSGQNVLYSYLAMPFIAVFGLTEFSLRLPMALSGFAALVFMWLLAKRIRGERFALTALFFLCLCPWHIMASRWALESNLLPTLLLGGIYFTVRAEEREWSLLPAAILFGLSLYAYGTAYFFLPPFLVFAVIWLWKKLRPVSLCVCFAVFVAIALPITLCQLRNALGLPETTFLGLTLPKLTESRQLSTSVFGGGGFSAALDNFKSFLRILVKQTDGLPYNSASSGGLYYFFGLPLAAVGLVKCAVSLRHGEKREAPVLAALVIGFFCAFLIDVNINRINMVWLPLIYFISLGLYTVAEALRGWKAFPASAAAPAVCVAVCAALFFSSYRSDLGSGDEGLYYPGLGEAIEYVSGQEPESVFISYYVNQPYIFALFYDEVPPDEFISTVDYMNPDGAFRWVRSFGIYSFGSAESADSYGCEWLILHRSETGDREIAASFGQYCVCRG